MKLLIGGDALCNALHSERRHCIQIASRQNIMERYVGKRDQMVIGHSESRFRRTGHYGTNENERRSAFTV